MIQTKVVFLDRDGVINRYPGDYRYVTSCRDFVFLPDVFSALKRLQDSGYELAVISNQAGVAKGLYSAGELEAITRLMLDELSRRGVGIAGVYYCTHLEQDNCSCRKPKTGLIDKAVAAWNRQGKAVDLQSSFMVGDSIRDVVMGRAAGLRTILVLSGAHPPADKSVWAAVPDATVEDLSAAADIILATT